MDVKAIYEQLMRHFGSEVILGLTEAHDEMRDPFIQVAASRVDKVCLYCRVESALAFDFCQSITGVDRGELLGCVYHLFSYAHKTTLVLKADVPRVAPTLPTVSRVWPAADWYEREVFDLFGIHFDGHPDLRRLVLPDDWEGHPLRKDWIEPERYRGMPTKRENPLDLLDEA